MQYSVFLLLSGALGSVLFAPLSVRCALLLGAIDTPDGVRHLHDRPTPRTGGLAPLFASLLLSLAFLTWDKTVAAWLAGGALLSALGVTDDLYSLSPLLKLSAMLAVCALPAAFSLSPDVFSFIGFSFSLPSPLGKLFSFLWVLLLTNAFNLIDGSDGLSSTLALVGAASLFFLYENPASLLLFGAIFGFLPYNLPLRTPFWRGKRVQTRSFLGDTGSLFLGYSLAVLSLGNKAFPVATPLFFALPLFDLVRVFFTRLFQRKNPFHADRTHLHHRLLQKGYGTGAILTLCLLYALLFASVGLVATSFSL